MLNKSDRFNIFAITVMPFWHRCTFGIGKRLPLDGRQAFSRVLASNTDYHCPEKSIVMHLLQPRAPSFAISRVRFESQAQAKFRCSPFCWIDSWRNLSFSNPSAVILT
jgi:hypothetical protein